MEFDECGSIAASQAKKDSHISESCAYRLRIKLRHKGVQGLQKPAPGKVTSGRKGDIAVAGMDGGWPSYSYARDPLRAADG